MTREVQSGSTNDEYILRLGIGDGRSAANRVVALPSAIARSVCYRDVETGRLSASHETRTAANGRLRINHSAGDHPRYRTVDPGSSESQKNWLISGHLGTKGLGQGSLERREFCQGHQSYEETILLSRATISQRPPLKLEFNDAQYRLAHDRTRSIRANLCPVSRIPAEGKGLRTRRRRRPLPAAYPPAEGTHPALSASRICTC